VIEKTPKNSDYTFPFAKASIGMIKLLANMFQIGNNGKIHINFEFIKSIFIMKILLR
jgi:hypothetical protein